MGSIEDENLLDRRIEKYLRQNIKRFRKSLGLTQEQLAVKLQLLGCEMSALTITRIEKGDRFVPDFELKALAEFFNVDINALIK